MCWTRPGLTFLFSTQNDNKDINIFDSGLKQERIHFLSWDIDQIQLTMTQTYSTVIFSTRYYKLIEHNSIQNHHIIFYAHISISTLVFFYVMENMMDVGYSREKIFYCFVKWSWNILWYCFYRPYLYKGGIVI